MERSFSGQAKPPAPPSSPNDWSSKVGQAVSPAVPMATINGRHLRHLMMNKFPKTVKRRVATRPLVPGQTKMERRQRERQLPHLNRQPLAETTRQLGWTAPDRIG